MLVVGDVGLSELTPALGTVEGRLGREVDVTTYSAREFRQNVASGDHFLLEVLRQPRDFLKGRQRDLDDTLGKARGRAPSRVEKRAR